MNIVVLVKQVPAVSEIEIAQDNNLVRVGAPSMLNPVDKHAIEAAIAVKDAVGGTVTLITMGTAQAAEVMRDGIAVGADKGVLVSDERMAGSDTLATGLILAKAIEKIGDVDLVFTGKRSTDGDTGQIPPAVAQYLNISLVSYADSINVEGSTITATRANHGGVETVQAQLPAVVSVTDKSNTPRSPKIRGKMAAKRLSSTYGVSKIWASMQQVLANPVRQRKLRKCSRRNRTPSVSWSKGIPRRTLRLISLKI